MADHASPHAGNIAQAIAGQPCDVCKRDLPKEAKLSDGGRLVPAFGGHAETCALRYVPVRGQRIL